MKGADKDIWVLGDLRSEDFWRESLKVLAKGLGLAGEAGAALTVVIMGGSGNEAGDMSAMDLSHTVPTDRAAREALAHGAHKVLQVEHEELAVPKTHVYASVLEELVKKRRPWLVLSALNDFGRETAAFGAQRCRAGLIADCESLTLKDGRLVGRCPAWGGEILADIILADSWPMAFVTVQPRGVSLAPGKDPADGAEVERIRPERVESSRGLRLKGRRPEPQEARRLEQARIVVVGGAGLGDMAGFGLARELAASLGGEVGATRPPVLYHWVEAERMIGQTGTTVRPELLISVGTSGAVQYTAGILDSRVIVAVNRDPKAPIFQRADIGVVADARVFLPLLAAEAGKLSLRRLADAASQGGQGAAAPQGSFGDLVRRLREARGWSAEEFARKTGQTPDFIGHVENDRMSPPVGFIMRMARAMEVDPGTFLHKEEKTAIRDRRVQAFQERTQNYSYTTLTPHAEDSHLRAFLVTIEPHLAHKPVAYKHEGEEFIYVMGGELEFTLGNKAHVLKSGESIHFNSDVPHKLKSLSSDPTRCLVVLYTL